LRVARVQTFRFTLVGAPDWLRRLFSRLDARLPDLGLGDVLLVVARRPTEERIRAEMIDVTGQAV
jgi:hypothetical protein